MNEYAVILLKLLFAAAAGTLLGTDREKRMMPAGFRTYVLVSLGSCLVMMMNLYLLKEYGGADPTRMGAAVVTGIGFLCAGTIIVTRTNQVRGLTTSAALWACGCLGLAIGAGFYFAALVALIMMYLFLSVLRFMDRKIVNKARVMNVAFDIVHPTDFREIFRSMETNAIRTSNIDIGKSTEGTGAVACTLTMVLPEGMTHETALTILGSWENIAGVREVESE